MTNLKISPEAEQSAKDAQALLSVASQFIIHNANDYQTAADNLKTIKSKHNEIEQLRKTLKAPILEAGRKLDTFFKKPLNALVLAEKDYKRIMVDYQEKQERLQREAEKKARDEHARQQQEAEELALKEIENGNDEKADQILSAAEAMPAPIVVTNKPTVEGISKRDNWKAEITDLSALVKAVAEGKAPMTMIQANTKTIGQMARALKGSVNYPGVRFYNDKTIAARSA